jgi:hypothetical protein
VELRVVLDLEMRFDLLSGLPRLALDGAESDMQSIASSRNKELFQ